MLLAAEPDHRPTPSKFTIRRLIPGPHWRRCQPLRSGFAAAVVNNELWVFGGEDPQTLVLHAEVEVYNPASNSWRREPNMPLPRHGIWASVIGNKIYIPGGGTTPALINPTNTNQIFTVSATGCGAGTATVADFNIDGHPDWVVRNAATRQTAIWYLNNNVLIGGAFGPDSSGRLGTERCGGFQWRHPSRLWLA